MKTPKGTELPLIQVKGKDYLEVKYRIAWFREEHPDWTIETEIVQSSDKAALFKAYIKDPSGRTLATAHKYEDIQGFHDYREKSETSAVGRALALLGYGTVNAQELEEGDRIVDGPVEKPKSEQKKEPEKPKSRALNELDKILSENATSGAPRSCKCGGKMLTSKTGKFYYCKNFKSGNPDDHSSPIPVPGK